MDVKKIAITILCILVMGGIGFGGYKLGEKKGREEIPNEIIVINSPRVEDEIVEEEIKVERVINEDLLASENTLKSKNNEYKMWIQMPNTNINYPVMQGPDNDIYLSTDFNGDYYYPGSIFIDYRNDKRYVGLSNMVHRDNRSLYGLNFTFDTIPNELVPYDYDAFLRYKGTFKCVVTNVLTGKPEYKTFTGYDRTNQLLRATCALPLAFPLIYLDGTPYLDGGLSDSIPFEKAFEDGCDRVIVVLTREAGYQKQTTSSVRTLARAFLKYPEIQRDILLRAERYNRCLKRLERYEKEGRCLVIRPTKSKGFGKIEKDFNKILSMYNDGYNQTYSLINEIQRFYH